MNAIDPSPRFRAKLSNMDRAARMALQSSLVVVLEKRHAHFAKTRTAKDGEAYRRTNSELALVRAALRD